MSIIFQTTMLLNWHHDTLLYFMDLQPLYETYHLNKLTVLHSEPTTSVISSPSTSSQG